jgi:hypothetical protein
MTLNDLQVDTRVEWDWQSTGRTYKTAQKSFEIDVMVDSDDPIENHRIKTADGWEDV